MTYRITWLPSAEQALLQIVISRPDRGAIVSALDRLGTTLEREGSMAGESREGEFRVLFELPLAAKFVVEESERTVTVTDVWVIGEPN
jgi:hypothetical protein